MSSIDYNYDYPDHDIDEFTWELSMDQELIILIVVIVLALVTFMCGVISWCIIKKFRTYRNYVFLNAILSNLLYISCKVWLVKQYNIYGTRVIAMVYFYNDYEYYAHEYLLTVKFHWLIIISHLFFVDIVKVFNGNIQKRYFKSAIFGWGVSLITTAICASLRQFLGIDIIERALCSRRIHYLICSIMISPIIFGNQILPGILNCYFYIRTVLTLWLNYNASTQTPSYIWRRLYIATLIFVLSDALLLYNSLIKFHLYQTNEVVNFFITLFGEINPLILDVFFIILKSNRKTWYEFYVIRFNQRQSVHDINMQRRITRQPACSQATVPDYEQLQKLPVV